MGHDEPWYAPTSSDTSIDHLKILKNIQKITNTPRIKQATKSKLEEKKLKVFIFSKWSDFNHTS